MVLVVVKVVVAVAVLLVVARETVVAGADAHVCKSLCCRMSTTPTTTT